MKTFRRYPFSLAEKQGQQSFRRVYETDQPLDRGAGPWADGSLGR